MKISKKILAIALSVMMILSVMPFAAFAATTTTVSTVTEFVTAVAKASAGDTIKLGANIDFTTDSKYAANSYSVEASYVDITGLTIDLDRNTITNNTAGLKFSGSNCVIKNGKIIGVADTYTRRYGLALWNYDAYVQGEADSIPAGAVYGQNVVLEDLEVDGGINILGHRDVIIRDCTVYGNSYYAVYLNFASDVTIESGSYTAANTKANGIVACYNAASLDPQYSTKINIEGGTFTLAKSDLVLASSGPVEISGGTYKKADSSAYTVPAKYIAEGAVQDSETGTVTQTYVAKVNDTCYETLEEAIAAANAGDTVKLLDDIDFRTEYSWGKAHYIDISGLTLDLNSHTINVQNFGVIWTGKNLTIKNGTFVGEKRNSTSYGLHLYGKDNTGTDLGDAPGAADVPVQNAVLEGLTIVGGANIWYAENVVLRNCNVQGQNYYAVWANTASDVTIESGTYTSDGKAQALLGASKENLPAGKMTITGGDFTVPANKQLVLLSHAYQNVKISGGTFNIQVPEANWADGYVGTTTPDAQGKYTVEEDTSVAEIAGTKYATLEEAIAAAQTGDTVTLLQNVDFTVYPAFTRQTLDLTGVTLDLDGHTITGYNHSVVYVGDNFTIKNGNMVCVYDSVNNKKESYAAVIYPQVGNWQTDVVTDKSTGVVLENLVLTGGINCFGADVTVRGENTNVTGNYYYALWADVLATLTVEDGTFTSAASSTNGIIGACSDAGKEAYVYISGGEYTVPAGKNLVLQSTMASSQQLVEISGGTYNVVVPAKACAEGFVPVTTPDAQGKYTVERSEPNNGVNLTVGNDITSNYYVDYEAYEGAYEIEYTYNIINEEEKSKRETKSVYLNNIEDPNMLSADGRLVIAVSQAPAQIGEVTEIKILNESHDVLKTLEYSSKTYCDNIIAMDDEEIAQTMSVSLEKAAALKKLCHVIIAYGEAAQGVFADYKTTPVSCTSKEVTDMIDDATRVQSDYKVYNNGRIHFRSVSFACTKDARLRFFLDTSDATGTPSDPEEKNGHTTELKYFMDEGVQKYFIEVSGINAADFDQKMIVEYGGSTIRFSVLDFCTLALSNGEVSMQKLARTLIVYNQLAEEYENI